MRNHAKIGITAALLLSLSLIAAAQSPSPAFEVASIKPGDSGNSDMSIEIENEKFKAINATVSYLIQYAYSIQDFQLSGGPGWMRSEPFDIDARPNTKYFLDYSLMTGMLLMTRTLLEDRFKLKVHTETRTLPVYDLVVAEGGPKFSHGFMPKMGGAWSENGGQITISTGTVASLAKALSNLVARKVIDKTGLTGDYDMEMKWPLDADPDNPASIFTAIQEQLGLKLVSSQGPVDVIVVDSVQKPSTN